MKHMLHRSNAWQLILLAVVFMGAAMALTSCGDDDEPKSTVVDYYLNVEEEFLINGSTDHTDRYYSPITRMKSAIAKAYPTPDSNGADEAVVAACDKEYVTYLEMYEGGSEHFTCLFHLVKAVKKNGIVIENQTLKTYVYDINPYDITPDD